jgi:hypothetical protein
MSWATWRTIADLMLQKSHGMTLEAFLREESRLTLDDLKRYHALGYQPEYILTLASYRRPRHAVI